MDTGTRRQDNPQQSAEIRVDLTRLPFPRGCLDGIWAHDCYVHMPSEQLPSALHDAHRVLRVGGHLRLTLRSGGRTSVAATDTVEARKPAIWDPHLLDALFEGAGFDPAGTDVAETDVAEANVDVTELAEADVAEANVEVAEVARSCAVGSYVVGSHVAGFDVVGNALYARTSASLPEFRLVRQRTLADTVGPNMSMLIVGLNPSLRAADAGVGFVSPSNRFWKAAVEAGLISKPRNPPRALEVDGVGMTDLVKRATTRASEVTAAEYRHGLARLDAMVGLLKPAVVCVVGITGWRAAIGEHVSAGPQGRTVGGRPVYLMPNPSGLNAHTNHKDLVEHFLRAGRRA